MTLSTQVTDRVAAAIAGRTSRRGFLGRTAMVGSALAAAGPAYVLRPGTAYAAVTRTGCSDCGGEGPCCDGYTEFCCHLEGGTNECPPGSVLAGWWKVDESDFCFGTARYYMDCNRELPDCECGSSGTCQDDEAGCGCTDCASRKDNCTEFRYGNCNNQIACVGPIVCRVVTCTQPWEIEPTCSEVPRTDELTRHHHRPCLERDPTDRELAFVRALYVDFLGRESDPTGESYWGSQLVRGSHLDHSVHDVIAASFAYSEEYTEFVVRSLYRQALDRRADRAETEFWAEQLRDELTAAELAASLFGSDEFFDAAGGDVAEFIARLYRRVLGRPPGEDEQAYWSGRLDDGATRPEVARDVFGSEESRQRRVRDLYQLFLDRRPEPDGEAYWTEVLAEREDIALATFLAASDEYDRRAFHRFPPPPPPEDDDLGLLP